MYSQNSFYDDVLSRLDDIEGLESWISSAGSRLNDLDDSLEVHDNRITALETWKGIMPKRSDRYAATTDGNGDLTVTFPIGRYSSAPHIDVSYIFNNDNYGSFHNIKSLSKDSVTIRLMRNKNTSVVLGGNIDPDEPIMSAAVVIIATEYA